MTVSGVVSQGTDHSNARRRRAPRPATVDVAPTAYPAAAALGDCDVPQRADELRRLKIEFVPHPEFSNWSDSKVVEAEWPLRQLPAPIPEGLPAYIASLYEVPLLSNREEEQLFLRMNFLKFRAVELRKLLSPRRPRATAIQAIEVLLNDAVAVRNYIVRANLRLVVALAKKFVERSTGLEELVSEGHMPLIRAVELFDVSRGYRFSTYGTWAVRNHFARLAGDLRKQQERFSTADPFALEQAFETRTTWHESESRFQQQRSLVAGLLTQLPQRDQEILTARFGLAGFGAPQTLSEIGRGLGISKERVRQLTLRALERLRELTPAEPQEAT